MTTNLEELLTRANPVADPEELRLSEAEARSRCDALVGLHRDALQVPVHDPISGSARVRRRRVWAFGLALTVALIVIGGAAMLGNRANTIVTDPPVTTTAAPVTTATTAAPTTTMAAPTTTTAPTTTPPPGGTTVAPTTTRDPLEPPRAFDPPEIYPPEGLSLKVVGVEHDGALNVREAPGLTRIVTTLGSLNQVTSAGEGRELPSTTWWKVDADGTIGWVNADYLSAWVSAHVDLTSFVEQSNGGTLIAATVDGLGRLIGSHLVSGDRPYRIALVAPPADATTNPDLPIRIVPSSTGPGDRLAAFDVVTTDPLGLSKVMRGEPGGQTGWRFVIVAAPHEDGWSLERVQGRPLIHACVCWER